MVPSCMISPSHIAGLKRVSCPSVQTDKGLDEFGIKFLELLKAGFMVIDVSWPKTLLIELFEARDKNVQHFICRLISVLLFE